MTRLSDTTLAGLDVPTPSYNRSAVTAGIVHVGVGGFHRAHEAVYVERVLAVGGLEWGICGVGTQPGDRRMRDVLHDQNGLFTVVVKHPDGRLEPRVVGSLVDYLYAPDDPDAVIERMAAETTHIVSLTITEGGYAVDPHTGRFTPNEPAVLLDVQRNAAPLSVFGLNGTVAREAFSGFASLFDDGVGEWVRREVPFPSSMVDRITPATTVEDRAVLTQRAAGRAGAARPWRRHHALGAGVRSVGAVRARHRRAGAADHCR